MSYRINVRGRSWGLIFREIKAGVKKDRRVKKGDLRQYGFLPEMSIEEAKSRAAQLNSETKDDRAAERSKHRSLEQAGVERSLKSKHFPPSLVSEFEKKRLKAKFEFAGDNPEKKYKKAISRWRFARRMLIDIDMKIEDWADEPRVFYRYFIKKKISLDYAGKVLGVCNLWGQFMAKKQGRAFLPIPSPRGHDREAIVDAYNKSDKKKKDSLPLTPELLANVQSKLKPLYHKWFLISLWFGLRPGEIGGRWEVITEIKRGKRLDALAVYQTKLTTLSDEKRWKYIPILYKEQRKALELLRNKEYKRPPQSAINAAFLDGYTLYMGRKGFEQLMHERGQHFEDISVWLGHLNVNQTYRNYKNRSRISLRGVG